MQSVVVLLAAGLCYPAACQQYHIESYDSSFPRGEAPLLSVRSPVFPPGSIAPVAFDPPTANEVHYAPGFRGFYNLVPTSFINIDRRFTHPPGFYYQSTLYMTDRSDAQPIHEFPIPSGYQRPSYNRYSPQVYEPGGDSYDPQPPDFQPRTHPQLINREYKVSTPPLYSGGGSYAPSFRDNQPPKVYETPPLISQFRPNQLSTVQPIHSTSPNIIRDDETSTRGAILTTNEMDTQNYPFHRTASFYDPPNTTELPRFDVTPVSPPNNSGGGTFPRPGSIPVGRNFVPSLFDTRLSPPSNAPPIFVPSDSPNIIRGETTISPSNPGYDVSEPQGSTYLPSSHISDQRINTFSPTSSPQPSIPSTEMTLEGLFTPRMFTPFSYQPTHLGDSPDIYSRRRPHVVFEAPGHENPK